ncbi:reprolysin-like metallopeptidase [Emticicia fontis]
MKLTFYLKATLYWSLLLLCSLGAKAQKNYFIAENLSNTRLSADPSLSKNIKKTDFYQLKESELRAYLSKAPLEFSNGVALPLEIPLPNGKMETFHMFESPILSPQVAANHPEIKTYTGRGQSNTNYTIRISFTGIGFNAIVLGIDNDAAYYDKVSKDTSDHLYRVYFAKDAISPKSQKSTTGTGNKCGVLDTKITLPKTNNNRVKSTNATTNNSGATLRTFRLAMAADAEFTQQAVYGGNKNNAFAGLVGYVNRVNAVYRAELSVAFTLVSDVNVVFTNTATDPYNNNDQTAMLEQNQMALDSIIGNANYDIGHVLGTALGSGGGIAFSPSACNNDVKGAGVSGVGDGSFAPVFDDQLITHEMGHQFGMSHSYNSSIPVCTTREPGTSVEPGSGTTIMSYGYTCSDETGNDDYESSYQPFLNFHTVSYAQAEAYIATLTCFTTTNTNNTVPVINSFPANITIPKSTPFVLKGTASDANSSNVLSYSWEGTNVGTVVPDPTTLSDNTKAPFFRSYPPVATGIRYYPRLEAVLNGTNKAIGDKLPSVGVVTTHRMTVRDGVGGVTYSQVTVTVDANSGPFLETTNLAGTYTGNTSKIITWSVANTTAAPVNCAQVNILLSTDGGLTFPITLAANTPNDGTESIILPNVNTATARIKVESSNNIFFDISNSNFSITSGSIAAPTNVLVSSTAICSGTSVTLSANCAAGVITWYNVPTGGSALGTGNGLSQSPTANTTYYATCESGNTKSSRVATSTVLVNAPAVNLTANISSGSTAFAATQTITASNKVISPAKVDYKAGNAIVLNTGFETQSGSTFKASIEGCP